MNIQDDYQKYCYTRDGRVRSYKRGSTVEYPMRYIEIIWNGVHSADPKNQISVSGLKDLLRQQVRDVVYDLTFDRKTQEYIVTNLDSVPIPLIFNIFSSDVTVRWQTKQNEIEEKLSKIPDPSRKGYFERLFKQRLGNASVSGDFVFKKINPSEELKAVIQRFMLLNSYLGYKLPDCKEIMISIGAEILVESY